MKHVQEVHNKNNQLLSLIEILYTKHKEFYKKYSPNSTIEYFTKNGKYGVNISADAIRILSDTKSIVDVEFGYSGWGGTIQPKYWEFEATNSDTEFNIWLSYHSTYYNGDDDLMIVYDTVSKTVMFNNDILEFSTGVSYNFKTKADMEEILFKVSLELPNVISYAELKEDMDRIRDFKKRKLPKGTLIQIWTYEFPLNIKELLEGL